MSTVIVPARFASSRFPGKVLEKIGGVPMVVRVAERCLKTKADRVIIVTDDERVLRVCEKLDGVEVTMSSPDIKTGTDRVAKVATYLDDDIIINVQGDEPFIDPALIDSLITALEEAPALNMVTACVQVGEDEAKSPDTVKVVLDRAENALYFSRYPIPYCRDGHSIPRYKHIGIYGFRRNFLLEFTQLEPSALEDIEKLEQLRVLENGIKIRVVKTDYNPISVDTPDDLEKACRYAAEVENG